MSEHQDTQSNQTSESQQTLIVNSADEFNKPAEPAGKDTTITENAAQANQQQNTGSQNNTIGSKMSKHTNYTPPSAVKNSHSGGKGMAVGALVLSLLALGASGMLFVEGQNLLKNQQLQFDHKIDAAGINAGKNAAIIQTSLTHVDELARQLQELQQLQKTQGDSVDKLNRAYQELVKSRSDWLVDEIEATLNLASQQLLISGNVPVAVGVLENLETRLSRFAQPQLLPIKKAISSDLENLKNRPYLDVASVSLRLNRLESAIVGLPLTVDNQLQAGNSQSTVIINPNSSWLSRTWQSTLHHLRGMVEIRHLDHNDSMLMSPEQIFFVRENLRLRLLDARIALLQRRSEVYVADLNNAEAAVKQYFDSNSAATQSWLKELNQLKLLNIQNNQENNILFSSLTAVRDYQKQSGMDMSTALPDLGASAVNTLPASTASSTAPSASAAISTADKPANSTTEGELRL
ncbi:MAG: uroporphyrinogen-III C-methyltransferase [Snodgrassella sp.]|nr:uroporphyrinogen-III C-methyltransferase [Snodgrassella sp.]